ncbi:MAG: hypothetical protein WCA30_14740 [Dermatophilaceae bacterium]
MGKAFWIDTPALAETRELALVHVSAWRETYGAILPERFLGASALERGLAMTGPTRAPSGFSARAPEQLFILYVLAAWHGRGVGQALLDRVVDARPEDG